MATFGKQFSCFSLIILFTCFHTQARESKFFFKYIHFNTNNFVAIPSSTNLRKDVPSSPSPSQAPMQSQISAVPELTPAGADAGFSPAPAPITLGIDYSPTPAPTGADSAFSPASTPITLGADYVPAPAPEDEVSYYGLYGTNTNNNEEEKEEEEEFSTENREGEVYTYNNAFSTSDQKSYYDANNGYDLLNSEPQGMSNTRTVEDGKYYYSSEQETYSASEPQGMSDTRLANGEFYGGSQQKNDSPSWGENRNDESKYEFDSMEEYEKQEGYADVEQQFTSP